MCSLFLGLRWGTHQMLGGREALSVPSNIVFSGEGLEAPRGELTCPSSPGSCVVRLFAELSLFATNTCVVLAAPAAFLSPNPLRKRLP